MTDRRDILRAVGLVPLWTMFGGLGSMLFRQAQAADWNAALFQTKAIGDAEKEFAGSASTTTGDIHVTAPDIAENGAVVPIAVITSLPNVREIAVLVEKNPNMVAAVFSIPQGTEPSITTRVKLGQTSDVIVLVKTDRGLFSARRSVKVTLGGCGG